MRNDLFYHAMYGSAAPSLVRLMWGQLLRASSRARLAPGGSIYAQRHAHFPHTIEGGVPLNVIADNCGTSVRMIEKTYAKILAEKRRDFIERGAPTYSESRIQ